MPGSWRSVPSCTRRGQRVDRDLGQHVGGAAERAHPVGRLVPALHQERDPAQVVHGVPAHAPILPNPTDTSRRRSGRSWPSGHREARDGRLDQDRRRWGRAPTPPPAATLRRLERASGALATQSVARMDEVLPWFRVDAGRPAVLGDARSPRPASRSFVEWLRSPGDAPRLTSEVFRAGPQELARSVSLQAGRRAGPGHRRGGRGAGGELRRAGRGDGAAGGDPALQPGDRLRRRPGVRRGGRDARRLGRPAGGAGRRRAAARRRRRDAAEPGRPRSAGRR